MVAHFWLSDDFRGNEVKFEEEDGAESLVGNERKFVAGVFSRRKDCGRRRIIISALLFDDDFNLKRRGQNSQLRAVEKESQFELDPEKAREALQKLDQQLQTLSEKPITPPKKRVSSSNMDGSVTWKEMFLCQQERLRLWHCRSPTLVERPMARCSDLSYATTRSPLIRLEKDSYIVLLAPLAIYLRVLSAFRNVLYLDPNAVGELARLSTLNGNNDLHQVEAVGMAALVVIAFAITDVVPSMVMIIRVVVPHLPVFMATPAHDVVHEHARPAIAATSEGSSTHISCDTVLPPHVAAPLPQVAAHGSSLGSRFPDAHTDAVLNDSTHSESFHSLPAAASPISSTSDPGRAGDMRGEMPDFSGSYFAYSAFALVILSIFYNILFITVIKPSVDGPEPELAPASIALREAPYAAAVKQSPPQLPEGTIQR
ncbi:hypothetical protein HHK36_011914 [Tetracentron sinense]|uniref:Uncharacterized protein n=1 Tax=Tetracentron sinense TaxID=13715 RepID=A0A834ZEM3_TETSI|nr:hypothetical protein HHK36_011914 [Tetracentron sinense]